MSNVGVELGWRVICKGTFQKIEASGNASYADRKHDSLGRRKRGKAACCREPLLMPQLPRVKAVCTERCTMR
jgi:hypothetical protein